MGKAVEFDTSNWPVVIRGIGASLNEWLKTVDPNDLLLALLFVVVVFLLRKKLADWAIGGLQLLLNRFSVALSEQITKQLKVAFQVLAVTFALYMAQDTVHPPVLIADVFQRLLGSVALIAVFATWFELSGPFVSLLVADKIGPAAKETDWMQRISQFAILLFGLTSLLELWQVDISGALTGVGVLGAGLAIATQDLIRNLVAGMTNMSEKRFETGDAIQVEGQFVGTVKKIDLRSTLVIGFDQIPRHIPNSELSNSVVLNYTAREHRRVMLSVQLVLSSTQEQIETVRDELRLHHQNSGDFDLGPDAAKHIYVTDIGPSSVDILIYVWTKGAEYDDYLQTMERLTMAVMAAVEKSGTKLAYPTQTVQFESQAPQPKQ